MKIIEKIIRSTFSSYLSSLLFIFFFFVHFRPSCASADICYSGRIIPPLENNSDSTKQLITRCRATNFARVHNEFPLLLNNTLIVQLTRERGSIVRSLNSLIFN